MLGQGATADGCLLPSLLFSRGLSCNGPPLLLAMPTMKYPKAALSGGFVIVGLSSFAHAYPPGYHANTDGSNQCQCTALRARAWWQDSKL